MDEVRYELLRPSQIVERRTACPLAFLPLGGIEWHGPQNPVGLDGLKVHELCIRAAQRGGGLVFPVPWYGEHRELHLAEVNRPVREAVSHGMALPVGNFQPGYMGGKTTMNQMLFYQEMLFHIYHQIRSLGFEAIYILVGHGPLAPYAALTAQVFERATGVKTDVSSAAGLVEGFAEDHGGRFETGVMMALRPELVDLSELPADDKIQCCGIDGQDPRQGSAELRESFVPACVERLMERSRRLLLREPSQGAMHIR